MNELQDRPAPGLAVSEPETGSVATDSKTILLLDSVEVFLRFEATILQRRDWRVLSALTGREALDILAHERVDLIIMDHALADLRGEHLIRAVRSRLDLRATSILIVSAAANKDEMEACVDEGANAYLFKPVSRASLCRTVEELLAVAARRHVRTLVRLDVEEHGERRASFGHTVNLSAGGMLVESTVGLSLGDCVDLRFHLPGDPQPVMVTARVMRIAAADGHCGLSFERLDDDDRRRIDAFVSSSHAAPVGWSGSFGTP